MHEEQLTLKYRPKTWKTFVGNNSVAQSIQQLIEEDKLPKAILLSGPSGTGKTTIARIIKNQLGASNDDYREYDIGDTRGIDNIRTLSRDSIYKPLNGNKRIYLLDEIQGATPDAFSAMLKWLEDAPKHVLVILATTHPQKLPKAVLTRCTQYELKPVAPKDIMMLLKKIVKREGKEDYDTSLLKAIVKQSEGSPRQALSILQAVLQVEDTEQALELINKTVFSEANVLEICRMIVQNVEWNNLRKMLEPLDKDADYEHIRWSVLNYTMKVLAGTPTSDKADRLADILELFSEPWFYTKKAGLVKSCYFACKL